MTSLLSSVLQAHGGLDSWNQLHSISADIHIRGNLLLSKGCHPFYRDYRIEIHPHRLEIQFDSFGTKQYIGICNTEGIFLKHPKTGETIQHLSLKQARSECQKTTFWKDIHLLYFLGYALWNYMVSPFCFSLPTLQTREIGERTVNNKKFQCLEVVYPSDWPTHCPKQIFYFDERFWLCRLDYSADIFGKNAKAAHYCLSHQIVEGFVFSKERKAFGRLGEQSYLPFLPGMQGNLQNIELRRKEKS